MLIFFYKGHKLPYVRIKNLYLELCGTSLVDVATYIQTDSSQKVGTTNVTNAILLPMSNM